MFVFANDKIRNVRMGLVDTQGPMCELKTSQTGHEPTIFSETDCCRL